MKSNLRLLVPFRGQSKPFAFLVFFVKVKRFLNENCEFLGFVGLRKVAGIDQRLLIDIEIVEMISQQVILFLEGFC